MKKMLLVVVAFTGLISGNVMAQTEEATPVRKKVKKEVKMEVVNGVKTLTIKSNESGYPTEAIYTGEEAEKKMAELEAENPKSENTVEVEQTTIGGKKQLKVVTTTDGVKSVETFEGKKAKKKLKQIEKNKSKKKVIVKKTETIEVSK